MKRIMLVTAALTLGLPVAIAQDSTATATATSAGGRFVGVTPARALDTRNGARLIPNVARTVPLSARPGAVGVSLNLTVTRAAAAGFATLHPCSQTAVGTSSVNFLPGRDVANASPQMVLDGSGICVTSSVPADVVVDITGWWSTSEGTSVATQTPHRVLDTRGGTSFPLQRTLPVTRTAALGLTVIVTRPKGAGFASVQPCASPATTSVVNFGDGETVANFVIVDASAPLCLTTSVPADVVIDEVATASSGTIAPVAPTRLFDTRDQIAWIGAGGLVRLPVGAARSVFLNVTVVRPLGGGFVTVWPCNQSEPTTSALSWSQPITVATAVAARADSEGNICLRPSVDTHLIADLLGSDVALPSGTTPTYTGRTNELVLGSSVQGRPIVARAYGTAAGRPVLGVGVIHGDEQSGLAIVADLKAAKVPPGVEMWLIDSVNPDGMALDQRQNANGVDLNRNWPTNWQSIARSNNYSGTGPVSEPETRATLAFINLIKPVMGVWWHTVGDYVDDSRSSVADPDLITNYAATASIGIDDAPCLGYCGGTATQHINAKIPGTTHMVVELPSPLSAAGAARHANAFLTIAAQS